MKIGSYKNIILIMVLLLSFNSNPPSISQDFMSNNMLEKGTIAPKFELLNSDNASIKLSDYKGKVVLLDFWYVGCKPCIKVYADIQNIQKELGKENFVVLGMNPFNRKSQINRYKKKYNYSDMALICTDKVKDAYKVRAYPSIYLIDKDGKIAFASAGYYAEFREKLKAEIKKIM